MAFKVFLVDDDRYVRKGLINLIDWEACGFEVCAEADNGEDALLYIRDCQPELVITDIKMPVLDGLELIKHTLELENATSNFVIITGYSDFKYAQKAVKYGVHDFILKPVDKDEIEKTLKKVAEEQTKKLQVKRNREKALAAAAFNELITAEPNKERFSEYIMNLDVTRTKGFVYVIIEANNDFVHTTNMRDAVSHVIKEDKSDFTVLFREHGSNQLGLLVSMKDVSAFKKSICHFSNDVKQHVARQLKTDVAVYIGKMVQDVSEIKASYQTAVKALQFKYLEDSDVSIVFGDTKNETVHYTELDQTLYQTLLEQIEENRPADIQETVETMFEQFQTKAFAKDAVKTSINRVIHEVVRTVQSMDGEEENLESLQKVLDWDHIPCSLHVTKDMFLAFLLEAAALLSQLNQESGTVTMRRIKRYVDTHYQEDLTLKKIANTFFLNPVYMGQLFKKTYGLYFKDYVLQVRINEAKKKLRQTDLRIFQVAESVGFSNADYFVTKFEKVAGMTPTQYRKNRSS